MQITIGLNQEAVDEWIEYRQSKKKPLSELALKKVIKRLSKFDEETQQRMVDRAIENDWTGLHDIEAPKENTTRMTTLHHDLTDKSWAH